MLPKKLRQIAALVLALALTMGLLTHGIGSSDMGLKFVMTTASDMPMTGKCDGCGDNQNAVAAAACSAYCGTVVALPILPVAFDMIAIGILGPSAGPAVTSHAAPPDPYPPRPIDLS